MGERGKRIHAFAAWVFSTHFAAGSNVAEISAAKIAILPVSASNFRVKTNKSAHRLNGS
jgi:hypothetical protein